MKIEHAKVTAWDFEVARTDDDWPDFQHSRTITLRPTFARWTRRTVPGGGLHRGPVQVFGHRILKDGLSGAELNQTFFEHDMPHWLLSVIHHAEATVNFQDC